MWNIIYSIHKKRYPRNLLTTTWKPEAGLSDEISYKYLLRKGKTFMRPFKELYDNKNHADLRELEKSYDRFRDTVRTLFKKVDQAADEAETRYLMETVTEAVVKKEREENLLRYINKRN